MCLSGGGDGYSISTHIASNRLTLHFLENLKNGYTYSLMWVVCVVENNLDIIKKIYYELLH